MMEPLTPAGCDLRDYVWMPLDCNRLLASETWVLGNAEEKVAALTLWMKSWHQVPAGSLPTNDKMLAHMSEAGTRWPRVREHALRGWVLCSDGRLYHPVVAEKAAESWEHKAAQKARTQAARAARAGKRSSVTSSVTDHATEDRNVDNYEETHTPQQQSTGPSEAGRDAAPQHGEKFNDSQTETTGQLEGQPIENVSNEFLSQRLSQAPPDQTRPDQTFKEEREDSPLPPPKIANAERADGEEEPSWPPKPHPSAITSRVEQVTMRLQGRARGQPFLTPRGPVRTVDQQMEAVMPKEPKANYAPPEVLAEARTKLMATRR